MVKVKDTQIGGLEGGEHEFLRDNEFIIRGYRLHFNSFSKLLKSLFMFHNESFNVWSHLFGVIIFLFLLGYTVVWLGMPEKVLELHIIDDLKLSIISTMNDLASSAAKYESLLEQQLIDIYKEAYTLTHEFEEKVQNMYSKISLGNSTKSLKPLLEKLELIINQIDLQKSGWIEPYNGNHLASHIVPKWPIFVFIATAVICLMCSSIFHLFSAHSLKINQQLSTLDYAGTSLLIAGSFYPMIYYTFYCFPSTFYIDYIFIYLSGMTIASLVTFVISFIPSFQSPSMRWFRGTLFVCLSFLGGIPGFHLFYLPQAEEFASAVWYIFMMGASYIIGVCIYVARVPERFFPGKFDFIGHSHNIWHIFVVAAAVFHYFGSLEVYHTRQQLKCLA